VELMRGRLSGVQEKILLDLARQAISCQLKAGEELPETSKEVVFHQKAATFVTLKISDRLRGCIGTLEPVASLWKSVHDNALSAAFHDHRFSPLGSPELEKVKIDISILSPSSLLEYTDSRDLLKKLQPGVDGVILKDGHRGATFLPQVWKQLQSAEQFLGQLCRKAGLEETAWQDRRLEIKVYQVLCFGEEEV
jgi:AmmeMemoRadiSam system protein A